MAGVITPQSAESVAESLDGSTTWATAGNPSGPRSRAYTVTLAELSPATADRTPLSIPQPASPQPTWWSAFSSRLGDHPVLFHVPASITDVGSFMPEIQPVAMSHIRKNITALGGIEKHTAALDGRSLVALEWTQLWARKHTGLRPVPAVVIRRALVCLADHLSNLDPRDIASEARAFTEAGKGSGSARSVTEARARIELHQECPAQQPMDHWRDALQSKEERAESKRMLDALEKRMEMMQ